jgi:hypothetical protein
MRIDDRISTQALLALLRNDDDVTRVLPAGSIIGKDEEDCAQAPYLVIDEATLVEVPNAIRLNAHFRTGAALQRFVGKFKGRLVRPQLSCETCGHPIIRPAVDADFWLKAVARLLNHFVITDYSQQISNKQSVGNAALRCGRLNHTAEVSIEVTVIKEPTKEAA